MAETETPPILLVEDDASLRLSLDEFLRDRNYRTVVAANLRQASELLARHEPWLCLLDLNLPDGSGLELLGQVYSENHSCRVIVMTAFDLQHLRPTDASDCLVGWLNKPVNPAELLRLVGAARDGQDSPQAA